MSALPQPDNVPRSDLTDSIAEALPPHLQAAYYREVMHCRSLPENDEMLRIIRILQILTYLIQQAPSVVVAERQRIEKLVASLTAALDKTNESMHEYQENVDRRLIELPEDLATRIQPAAIAKELYEGLRQEFARYGLLEIGVAFQGSVGQLEKLLARLNAALSGVESARKAAEREIRDSSRQFVQTLQQTSDAVIREGESQVQKHRWQRDVLAGIVIVLVFMLGMRYARWMDAPPEPPAPTIAPATERPLPAASQPKPRPKQH